MKISIASASTAAAATALLLAGAAPAAAKGMNPSRLNTPAAKQDCRQQTRRSKKSVRARRSVLRHGDEPRDRIHISCGTLLCCWNSQS